MEKSPCIYSVLCIHGTAKNVLLTAIKAYIYKSHMEYKKLYLLWIIRKTNLMLKKMLQNSKNQYFLVCMGTGDELDYLRYSFSELSNV